MLYIKNIYKKYNRKVIINDITLSFDAPGLYVLRGINGSGKSTIIKILAKSIYKSSGTFESNEVVSYLPDKFTLPKLLRVDKYLKEVARLNRSVANINELLIKWKIPKKRIGNLSKGNYQKLGIIQALTLNANYYLFDEPLDGLDDYAKDVFKRSILELIDCGKRIIMSLHEEDLFCGCSYKKIEIVDGKIHEED